MGNKRTHPCDRSQTAGSESPELRPASRAENFSRTRGLFEISIFKSQSCTQKMQTGSIVRDSSRVRGLPLYRRLPRRRFDRSEQDQPTNGRPLTLTISLTHPQLSVYRPVHGSSGGRCGGIQNSLISGFQHISGSRETQRQDWKAWVLQQGPSLSSIQEQIGLPAMKTNPKHRGSRRGRMGPTGLRISPLTLACKSTVAEASFENATTEGKAHDSNRKEDASLARRANGAGLQRCNVQRPARPFTLGHSQSSLRAAIPTRHNVESPLCIN